MLAGMLAVAAAAQAADPAPLTLEKMQSFTMPAAAAAGEAGLLMQCHLLLVEQPLEGTIGLLAPGRSALSLAEGQSCASATVRHRRPSESAATSPVLPFDVLGAGTYPIIVEAPAGARYSLQFTELTPRQRELRQQGGWRPVVVLGKPGTQLVRPVSPTLRPASPPGGEGKRVALMQQQIAAFEAYTGRIRSENAELRRRDMLERQRVAREEAEERMETARAQAADRAAGSAAIADAFAYAGNRIATGVAEAAEIRARFEAEQQAAQRRAQARAAAQQHVRQPNPVASAGPPAERRVDAVAADGPRSPATGQPVRLAAATPPNPATVPAAKIAMLEAVVVCPPVAEGRLPLCYGPFQNSAGPDVRNRMQLACGNRDAAISDFGTINGHRVWGCGYGINPTREGRSPNIDQARRFGLVVASRRMFRCAASISGYCRDS
jgi:hypothetical protein